MKRPSARMVLGLGICLAVLLADAGLSIVSFGELPDDELVALTFGPGIYRLRRRP